MTISITQVEIEKDKNALIWQELSPIKVHRKWQSFSFCSVSLNEWIPSHLLCLTLYLTGVMVY